MKKSEDVTLWPMLYFKADWPPQTYKFDLGVQLLKADKELLKKITLYGGGNNCWLSNVQGADNMRYNTDWYITISPIKMNEHVADARSKIGMSFIDTYQRTVLDSFLMCLNLIHSTPTILPFKLPADIQDGIIAEVYTDDDFYGINSEKPFVHFPETFGIDDLQTLAELWDAIIKFRKLNTWEEMLNKEEFFAACDKDASVRAINKMLEIIMSHPSYLDFPEKERKEHKKKWFDSIKEAQHKGSLQELYKDFFIQTHSEKQEQWFSDRTRIGRALNLFTNGLHLPILHSFLSMCLVLETLFTVGKGETIYKLSTRLAKIVGENQNIEDRKVLYKKTKDIYDDRSSIVHGEKLIDTVPQENIKEAFIITRKSLKSILCNDELLTLFSHPGTTDKKLKRGKKEEAEKALHEYFLKLDLGDV